MRMLDLFAGRLGWTKAFLARGWECVAIDLVRPETVPFGCIFAVKDVLDLSQLSIMNFDVNKPFDFICASPPCEEFSVHGLKCFHPDPPYPKLGIKLFNHARQLCECSGIPYVIENVNAAQKFVGNAALHCGPFYLWGTGVPPLVMQGVKKGQNFRGAPGAFMDKRPTDVSVKEWRNQYQQQAEKMAGGRKNCAGVAATIPSELANCVADYAEAICRQRQAV